MQWSLSCWPKYSIRSAGDLELECHVNIGRRVVLKMAASQAKTGYALALGMLVTGLCPLIAYGQSPSTADNIGLDFFRPPPSLFQL
jgi:hypothetical protein